MEHKKPLTTLCCSSFIWKNETTSLTYLRGSRWAFNNTCETTHWSPGKRYSNGAQMSKIAFKSGRFGRQWEASIGLTRIMLYLFPLWCFSYCFISFMVYFMACCDQLALSDTFFLSNFRCPPQPCSLVSSSQTTHELPWQIRQWNDKRSYNMPYGSQDISERRQSQNPVLGEQQFSCTTPAQQPAHSPASQSSTQGDFLHGGDDKPRNLYNYGITSTGKNSPLF